MIQFQLLAADTVAIPAVRVVCLGRAVVLGYKEDYGFKDIPRASWPRMMVGTDVRILRVSSNML
jgi:hypothetical protein